VSMSNPTDRVEIITSVQRRRRWTASEKVRIVEETFEPGMPQVQFHIASVFAPVIWALTVVAPGAILHQSFT
jgi:hypothetical protein